jgi:hypothetical protein
MLISSITRFIRRRKNQRVLGINTRSRMAQMATASSAKNNQIEIVT